MSFINWIANIEKKEFYEFIGIANILNLYWNREYFEFILKKNFMSYWNREY